MLDRNPDLTTLKRRASSKEWVKIFWNAKYDIPMLAKAGVVVKGPIIDAMIVAQMVKPEEKKFGLKHFARKYLGKAFLEEKAMQKWLRANPGKKHGLAPDHIVLPYAQADAQYTMELFAFLAGGLDEFNLWDVLKEEMRLLRVVLRMEQRGVLVDKENTTALMTESRSEIKKLRSEITKLVKDPDFNPNSPQQVARAVYTGKRGAPIPTRHTKSGMPQVNELALLEAPSEIGTKIVQFRKVSKTFNTYLKHFYHKTDGDDVLRVSFNQSAARTGRFSSSNPNLQNIPRPAESTLGKLRSCIRSRPGHRFVFVDYSQLEVRICAHFTKEEHMVQAILDGRDLHDETCKLVFGIDEKHKLWPTRRYIAKKLNLASQFGMGAMKFKDTVLHDTMGAIRLEDFEAMRFMQDYKSSHPALQRFFSAVTNEVAEYGGVFTHYGRFMPVDPGTPYKGVNYKVQGTAAQMLKRKMLKLHAFLRSYRLLTEMVMQIHDEIVFEVPHKERHIVPELLNIMEEHKEFIVPLTCSVAYGKHWHKKTPLKLVS